MNNLEQRKTIIETCLWLQQEKLVIGTWGNVSLRLDNRHILLTPSRVNYQELLPEDLVVADMDGNKVCGFRNATSEMDVHRLIYRARADVNAIIHCHPLWASAMCASGQGIPPILEEMTQLIGGAIPITSHYVRAGLHIPLAEETVHALGGKNAVLIANHAPVCCGRDMEEAKVCCQVTEKAAACYLAIKGNFSVSTIPPEDAKAEHHRFLYDYGHEHS